MDSKQLVIDLLGAFTGHDIDELEFTQGDLQIKMKRERHQQAAAVHLPMFNGFPQSYPMVHGASPPGLLQVHATSGGAATASAAGGETESALPTVKLEIIKAPMVGTFYRSPNPDSPPFVEPGQKVEPEHPLCIIEAMKQMNRFEAEFSCRIVNILVENTSMIEYGQPLFEVERL